MISETDKAYCAALFDGEGAIYITKLKPQKANGEINYRHRGMVSISNTDLDVLNWVKDTFGGNININCQSIHPCYTWRGNKNVTDNFLKMVYPYIKIKKAQIDLFFEFITYSESLIRPSRTLVWDAAIIQKKDEYKQKLQTLNGRVRCIAG